MYPNTVNEVRCYRRRRKIERWKTLTCFSRMQVRSCRWIPHQIPISHITTSRPTPRGQAQIRCIRSERSPRICNRANWHISHCIALKSTTVLNQGKRRSRASRSTYHWLTQQASTIRMQKGRSTRVEKRTPIVNSQPNMDHLGSKNCHPIPSSLFQSRWYLRNRYKTPDTLTDYPQWPNQAHLSGKNQLVASNSSRGTAICKNSAYRLFTSRK